MQLADLVPLLKPVKVEGNPDVEFGEVRFDSRLVRPGDLFVACPGTHHNGAEFLRDAVARGAVVTVGELPLYEKHAANSAPVTHVVVPDARLALAQAACALHENPSAHLEVVGVTGTNGKTSVVCMTRDILTADGRRPGVIGTIQYEIGERTIPASRTTPEAPDLQAMLRTMCDEDVGPALMEVSSHAMVQHRAWGVDFDVAVFTNLTREHLDYHGSMESYFAAKCRLFETLGTSRKQAAAIVNTDDPWGRQLLEVVPKNVRCLTLGEDADIRARVTQAGPDGTRVEFNSPWGEATVHVPLPAAFNAWNAVTAMSVCLQLGQQLDSVVNAVSCLVPVPGRLEQVGASGGGLAFVDYAHTGDALEAALTALRPFAQGRLIVVFGCGGDRDRGKRPDMGAIAAKGADMVILTSDNPRSEAPDRIIEDIAAGFEDGQSFEVEVDRRHAIEKALGLAVEGDVVLVAGKGHENYQEFRDSTVPFDDREVIRDVWGG